MDESGSVRTGVEVRLGSSVGGSLEGIVGSPNSAHLRPGKRASESTHQTAVMSNRYYRPIDYLLLFTLSAIWGLSFLFIKVAVATIPPMTLTAGRLWLAAFGLLLCLWATGRHLPRDPTIWRDFMVLAVAGSVVPFFLINWGEVTIDSGLAAILLATMPLATLILAHAFTRDDRLSPMKCAGILVGFTGVVVLVGADALAGLGQEVAAQLAVAGAACSYAVATVYARCTQLSKLPPMVSGSGMLLCAALLSMPLALAIDRPWTLDPSTGSILALVVLALLCTSIASVIFFRLLATTRSTFTALLNYLLPIFAVTWGAIFLSEPLRPDALAALALILLGLAMAMRTEKSGT